MTCVGDKSTSTFILRILVGKDNLREGLSVHGYRVHAQWGWIVSPAADVGFRDHVDVDTSGRLLGREPRYEESEPKWCVQYM